jgi:hypothetical protein
VTGTVTPAHRRWSAARLRGGWRRRGGNLIRGRLDLVTIAGPHASALDWKSGWASEDEEGLRLAWGPGLYAALLWAWAPRLDDASVECHYLRTGRVARVVLTRTEAAEALALARRPAECLLPGD